MTGFLETRKSTTSLTLIFLSGSPGFWVWDLSSGPRSNPLLQLSLICRSKTFVAEFAFVRYSQISHRIQISIHDCTFPLAGIRLERTQNLKTNSLICVKHCEGTLQKTNRTWQDNLSRQDRAELRELKSNQAVRVLPTDKNLGPALMSTDWVKTETLWHLSDELSYSKVTLEDWYVYRDNIIKRREQLMSSYCQFLMSLDSFVVTIILQLRLNFMLSLRYTKHLW